MNLPVLSKRRERKQADFDAAVDAATERALEKAGMAPALAGAPGATVASGATYPFNPSSPFMQTGGSYGANPLPRPNSDFGSLFGPGYPLFPDALDPLRPDGRSDPRRYQYPVTWNITLTDREIPWAYLRKIASEVDVVSRCIELVQDAVAGMSWSWGFSRQIINQIRVENNEPNSAKATVLARDKYGDELHKVQTFFERPDEKMGQTFNTWLTSMVWAHLVFDGIAIAPFYNLKGGLHSLSLLDPSTIKIILDNQGFLPEPPAPAYQQILYGFPRGEFQREPSADNRESPKEYRRDQLSYYIRRYRLHTPYGFSSVEECVNYASLYQQRQEWMHAEWSHGVTPKVVYKTMENKLNWTPEQYGYYQNAINDQWSGQTQRRQQSLVLPPGMDPVQLKEMAELYNSEYDQWLVMQIGAKFGVPQTQLGIPMVLHNLGNGQTTAQMDITDKFALDALVNFLVDCINDLARRYLGVGPEITIVAANSNSDDAALATAQADASDVNNGIRTRNEVRAERGIPLITEPEADELGVTTATGVTFLSGQLAATQAQIEILQNNAENANRENVGATDSANEPGRQRSSRLDEPADPKVQPGKKPAAIKPTGDNDKPHKQRSDARAQPDVSPKVSGAQLSGKTDAGSYTVKELSAFANFVKSRKERGSWRDFVFESVSPEEAIRLNAEGRSEVEKASGPIAAGVAVRAADTGRVLLLQRALAETDPAAGKFEFPGGHLEGVETPWEGALREWQEECGCDLPDGHAVAEWLSPNGIYQGFVYEVASEDDVNINVDPDRRSVLNPDDPDGDCPEIATWFNIRDLPGNSALRAEVLLTPWNVLVASGD